MYSLIKNGNVLNTHLKCFEKKDVLICDNKICDTGYFEGIDAKIIDANEGYVIPSFIDIHTHGGAGYDFMDENCDFNALNKYYNSHFTESVYATTITAPHKDVIAAVKRIKSASQIEGSVIKGIHIEGPYISTKRPGCHIIENIRIPSVKELDEICEASDGLPIRVAVAPEVTGAEDFIREAVKRGVKIGIGHSNATVEKVKRAISLGADTMIHLYNAMSPLHHRDAGCVGIGLTSDVFCELICDGHHVSSDVVNLTYSVKGPEKLVLITDSMRAAGMKDGKYSIGGVDVTLSDGQVTTEDGTLAGSVLNLEEAVKNLVKFSNSSLAEAVICATINPARAVEVDNEIGSIDIGKKANISILAKNV